MKFLTFIPYYFKWHYSYALINLWGIATNYLWFVWNYFSIGLLSRTILAPWKKMGESYGGGFNLPQFLSTLTINVLMRFVGAILRLTVIVVGIVSTSLVFLISIIAFVLWIFAPALALLCLMLGLNNIFSI